MNFNIHQETPLEIKVSFHKLIEHYECQKDSQNLIVANSAKTLLNYVDNHPALKNEFTSFDQISTHKKEINFFLQDLFHPALTNNEIKSAGVPFNNNVFMVTERFRKLLNVQNDSTTLEIKNMDSEYWYIIASSIILKACYGFVINFKRPFFYEIQDDKGIMRYYKILFNSDFVDVIPKDFAPTITKDDYELLLDNFDDLELWKEKFPPNSYEFKGFIISNVFDVTDDQSISNIKTALIGKEKRKNEGFMTDFQDIFRSLLGIENIKVGFSKYNQSDDTIERVHGYQMNNYLTHYSEKISSENALCVWSHNRLFQDKKYFSISNVEKAFAKSNAAPHLKVLNDLGVKSAIFAPITKDNKIMGILEIVSENPFLLNSINAQKLVDVMPFIITAVERSKNEELNLIEAIIQKECTSIHSSVHWRFEEEAKKYIRSQLKGEDPVFHSIAFVNIFPLYGQVDIKGSSKARNDATINDLNLQLQHLRLIFKNANKAENLQIYEQYLFKINEFISSLNQFFQVDSEHQINNYIRQDIHPVLNHLKTIDVQTSEIDQYYETIDAKTNSFYSYRKEFDDSVSTINSHLASLLDEKQTQAQSMFPHYYERFKTDGVEHNMYIGDSITKTRKFNSIYLYNLRLWQLQVMCEMENEYYKIHNNLKVKLDVASMILVFNQPLSISFKMDEKQFDVDGTYNARYEIVKKRVDKAFVKGTTERVTQKGKISIIYSQKEDEEEYLNYVRFLQSKNYFDTDVEILELQDLQAVSGLKAIRVSILYHTKENEALYTYQDLIRHFQKTAKPL
jgi:hypothetical protein